MLKAKGRLLTVRDRALPWSKITPFESFPRLLGFGYSSHSSWHCSRFRYETWSFHISQFVINYPAEVCFEFFVVTTTDDKWEILNSPANSRFRVMDPWLINTYIYLFHPCKYFKCFLKLPNESVCACMSIDLQRRKHSVSAYLMIHECFNMLNRGLHSIHFQLHQLWRDDQHESFGQVHQYWC